MLSYTGGNCDFNNAMSYMKKNILEEIKNRQARVWAVVVGCFKLAVLGV